MSINPTNSQPPYQSSSSSPPSQATNPNVQTLEEIEQEYASGKVPISTIEQQLEQLEYATPPPTPAQLSALQHLLNAVASGDSPTSPQFQTAMQNAINAFEQ